MIPAAAAAALAFVAVDAAPAQAQIVIRSGYPATGYYGGYAPGYGGVTVGNGMIFNPAFGSYPSYGAYPMYSGGYGTFGTYREFSTYGGYQPYYRNGYQPYYGNGYGATRYYGGRVYGGRR
jgi:hypothetical protein